MAPPLLAKKDPVTGRPRKRRFGPWMMQALKLLAKLKGLRGTAFDPFSYSQDRKLEHRLIADYEACLEEIEAGLGPATIGTAIELAALPEAIRGYGYIKQHMVETADKRRHELLAELRAPAPEPERQRAA